MTVSTTNVKHIYDGNGTTKAWDFTFDVTDENDIELWLTDTQGTNLPVAVTTNYTISLVTSKVTYPVTGDALTSRYKFTINRKVDLTQELTLTTFNASSINAELDQLAMAIQQVDEKADRAVKYPIDTNPASTDADTVLTTIDGYKDDAETAKTAAEAAQLAAETAQTNAETAETNAETAQGLAEGAQAAAEAAQGLAEGARDDAQGFASSASGSSSDASGFAAAASGSASAASGSALDAQTAQGLAEDARDASIAAQNISEDARDAALIAMATAVTAKNQALIAQAAADADAIQTAADRVQTGLDAVATAADRVQTGLDAVATAADRVQTGLDASAAQGYADDALGYSGSALQSAQNADTYQGLAAGYAAQAAATLFDFNMSGFVSWGGSGNYWSSSTFRFTVLRSGTGKLLNNPITWAGGEYVDLGSNRGFFIGYSGENTLTAIDYSTIQSADKKTFHDNFHNMLKNHVILFSVWCDSSGISMVVKNNHPFEYPTDVSAHDHFRLGSVFLFTGAMISVLSAGNRTIQSIGADLIDDHGVLTNVPDSTGSALSIIGLWKNGSALAQRFHRRTFTVSGVSVTPAAGATYTESGSTFTVLYTNIVAGSGTVHCWRSAGTADPSTSGTLTKTSGTGDASITYSAWAYQRVVPTSYNNAGTPTPLGSSGSTRYAIYAIYAIPDDFQTPSTAAPVPSYFALLPNTAYVSTSAAIASLGTAASPDLTQFTMPQEIEVLEPVLMGFVLVDGNTRSISATTSGGFVNGVRSYKTTPTNSTTSGAVSVAAAVNVHTDVTNFTEALTSADVNAQLAFNTLSSTTLTKTGTQVVTNKDIDGGSASDTSRITVGKGTTSALNALTKKEAVIVYDTTTKKVKVGDGSTWLTVGSSGGGSAINWRVGAYNGPAPIESDDGVVPTLDFPYETTNGVPTVLTVPNDYIAGTQILLKNGVFSCSATTNKVKFKITTYLIRAGTTVLGTYSNSHASTNTEVTVSGDASKVTAIGDVDLTSATGTINSVAVQGGDQIALVLIRDVANESASAAADAKLIRDSFTPFFG